MQCPECYSKKVYQTRGELHCRSCGLVIEDALPDFSGFRDGTSVTRPPLTGGRVVKASWLLSSREKGLQDARRKIGRVASRLELPAYVAREAYSMHERAVNRNLCVGRNSTDILHACLYAACMNHGIPRTVDEITEYDADKKQVLRAHRTLVTELGLSFGFSDPVALLPRFVSNLGLSHSCLMTATELLNKIMGTSMYSGKNPKSIVAAVIYIAAKMNDENITQRDIANQLGVVEVTIRKRYKEIRGL